MFSELSWTIWLLRNNICFNQRACDSIKTSVLNIMHWVLLWTGKMDYTEEIVAGMKEWLPEDTTHIPLQEMVPEQVLVESINTVTQRIPFEDWL